MHRITLQPSQREPDAQPLPARERPTPGTSRRRGLRIPGAAIRLHFVGTALTSHLEIKRKLSLRDNQPGDPSRATPVAHHEIKTAYKGANATPLN